MARLNDLTTREGLAAGTLQPVLLDWVGVSSPPLNLLIRKAVSRQVVEGATREPAIGLK